MRSLDGKAALLWLDNQPSRLSAYSDARLGVAPDLAALAMLIYGAEGSVRLPELTVGDTVNEFREPDRNQLATKCLFAPLVARNAIMLQFVGYIPAER